MSTQELISKFTDIAGPYALPALAFVGALSLLSCSYKWLGALSSLFILSGTNVRKYGPRGSWALVTGASDGVGKEFALQLAQKGFNIILVSRTASKLEALASEIGTKHMAIKTKTLAMDFEKDSAEDYDRLRELVKGLDVAVLINNVGRSHSYPVSFLETTDEEMENIITINVKGTLKVTKIVAPGMAERKRGLILTMGSFGGFVPTPFLATYSGSKAFLQHWSTALHQELKPKGVEVELVIAYLIVSAMSKIRKPSMMIPTPKAWVKSCLGKIGVTGTAGNRAGTITPYWSHGLMHWGIEHITGVYNSFVLKQNGAMHADIRRRALKKMERDAKKQ